MRDSYRLGASSVTLIEIEPVEGDGLAAPLYLVTAVETQRSARGNGVASALLREVTAEADREGATLTLSVDPDGSPRSLDETSLLAWYGRNGFLLYGELSAMVRRPSTLAE